MRRNGSVERDAGDRCDFHSKLIFPFSTKFSTYSATTALPNSKLIEVKTCEIEGDVYRTATVVRPYRSIDWLILDKFCAKKCFFQ
jgi:hypothetical protein